MNEKNMNEKWIYEKWLSKRVKIFVKNSPHAIVYTGFIKDIIADGNINFILINDRDNFKVWINLQEIIQIKEEEI